MIADHVGQIQGQLLDFRLGPAVLHASPHVGAERLHGVQLAPDFEHLDQMTPAFFAAAVARLVHQVPNQDAVVLAVTSGTWPRFSA